MPQEPSAASRPPIISRLMRANLALAAVVVATAAVWWVARGDDPDPATAAAVTGISSTTSAASTVAPATSSTLSSTMSSTMSSTLSPTIPPTISPTIPSTTSTTARPEPTTTSTGPASTAPPTTMEPYDGWVDPAAVGVPQSEAVAGVLTFRGSPTRTYYGEGPVPTDPQVLWSFPERSMCSPSTSGGVTRTWCGTGWTGQPAVWERGARTWVAFGAYDRNVHFVDGDSGLRILDDFPTGDLIKGSVTVDPDGYPLLYTGSRDGFFRVIAFDRGKDPIELWRLAATDVSPRKWNDDWDGSALVIDDHLFEGGENSQLHIVRLNRDYDDDGLVTVDPELVFNAPGWDDALIRAVGNNVSIENSVAISGNTLYFANSGGLVQGWDISGLGDGEEPSRVFRWWAGDDIDASIVVDENGHLYVGVEYERGLDRAREVGQIVKLDPGDPDDPLVWSVPDHDRLDGGVWATPALHRDLVIVPTDGGRVLGIDRETGEIRWTLRLPGPLWQSPVVVDDVLVQGDCDGHLRGFDVSDTTVRPPQLWSVDLGGCIESTPVVWRGVIYVGTRAGRFHAVG